MSAAFRCEVCSVEPAWRLLREGDAVVTWACPPHVSAVLDELQRDHEVTRVVVSSYTKSREWAEIGQSLAAVAEALGGQP